MLDGNAHPDQLRHPDLCRAPRDHRHAGPVGQRVVLPGPILVPGHVLALRADDVLAEDGQGVTREECVHAPDLRLKSWLESII
jgi:hypothetical protein